MEGELPFPLYKNHKSRTKSSWRHNGLIWENEAEFNAIYERLIYATQCDLCKKVFVKRCNRQMEHDHDTGEFRNIVCNKCNMLKADRKIQSDNTSGYKGICWHKGHNAWRFSAHVDGKQKTIKYMKDLEKLIEFRDEWYIQHNYYT